MERTLIIRICDFCGDEGGDTSKATISIGGKTYEVDLCASDLNALEDRLKNVKPVRGTYRRRSTEAKAPEAHANGNGNGNEAHANPETADTEASTPVPNTKAAEYSTVIRRWAQANGLQVSDAGRMPQAIVKQYREAHKAFRKNALTTTAA